MINNAWNVRARQYGSVREYNPSRPWYAYAKELLSRHVSAKDVDPLALDIGCGVGEFMLLLKDMGFTVEGIDANKEQMQLVDSIGLKGKVANLENGLPYKDDQFYLVTCLELIEHIAMAEVLLDEIKRVLRPGGYLLLSTPNFSFINSRVHYFFGEGPGNEGVHLRFFTKKRFEFVLEKAGFQIVERNSYGIVPLLSTVKIRILRRNPTLWRVPASLESLLAFDLIYLTQISCK
jgi:2-polyprenyl-3-methyl-5-hydroxy-6-metoxy-1,4-benzoquinol methylase